MKKINNNKNKRKNRLIGVFWKLIREKMLQKESPQTKKVLQQ